MIMCIVFLLTLNVNDGTIYVYFSCFVMSLMIMVICISLV